jgi:hypothetical protein
MPRRRRATIGAMGVHVQMLDGSRVDYAGAHGATEAGSGSLLVWRVGPAGRPEPVDEIPKDRWSSWWASWGPRTEADPAG